MKTENAKRAGRRTRKPVPAARAAVERAVRAFEEAARDGFAPPDLADRVGLEFTITGSAILDSEAAQVFRAMTAGVPLESLFISTRAMTIMQAVLALAELAVPVDFTAVGWWLTKHGLLETAGGPGMLTALPEYVFSTANMAYHTNLLLDEHRRDRLSESAERILAGSASGVPVNEIVAAEASELSALVKVEGQADRATTADANEMLAEILAATNEATSLKSAIPWRWTRLRQLCGPIFRGGMAIVVAPPNTGKTAFAQDQAEWVARVHQQNVVGIWMETAKLELFQRHAMRQHGVDGRNLTSNRPNGSDRRGLAEAAETWGQLGEHFFFLCDGPKSADEIDAHCMDWRREHPGQGIDLLVVDGLHAMTTSVQGGMATDYHVMSHTMLRLRMTCSREKCALILLCQPQAAAARQGRTKRPNMSDVKGGTPVEFAKTIIALHFPDEERLKGAVVKGEIVVVKANNGMEGAINSILVKPAVAHLQDTPEDRADNAPMLEKYGFAFGSAGIGKDRVQANSREADNDLPDY